LWIAFKICIFDFQKQPEIFAGGGVIVVNCFQNLYLWLSETAVSNSLFTEYVLWIAFKICIFDFQKQHILFFTRLQFGCELLSKFVSLTFRNSHTEVINLWEIVVNCFQNLYLWLSETAMAVEIRRLLCCELLSKFVSLTFRNSIQCLF